jgi:hypothetical protein
LLIVDDDVDSNDSGNGGKLRNNYEDADFEADTAYDQEMALLLLIMVSILLRITELVMGMLTKIMTRQDKCSRLGH